MNDNGVVIHRATRDELDLFLRLKLVEEAIEFALSNSVEELADVLEVVYAIAKLRGLSIEHIEELRLSKRELRGGFDSGYIVTWLNKEIC
ncbi:MAG TPA: hypothetical protein ENF93_01040 [Ignisphaera sp.]|nr:hypothetical protein [Ignisphaera sp.]